VQLVGWFIFVNVIGRLSVSICQRVSFAKALNEFRLNLAGLFEFLNSNIRRVNLIFVCVDSVNIPI
jgi:hypothetical protein